MSEEPDQKKEDAPWKKIRHVTPKVKAAILDLIEQTRVKKRPNISKVAAQHDVKVGTLRQTWYRWCKGRIDLGPQPKGQREIKMRVEMTRTIDACSAVDQHLNDILERKMEIVNKAKLAGDFDEYYKQEIDKILGSLLKSNELRKQKEKGYLALMEPAPIVKNVTPHPATAAAAAPPPAEQRVQRALEARAIEEIFGDDDAIEAEVIPQEKKA